MAGKNPYEIKPPNVDKLNEALTRLDAADEHLRKMQAGGIDVADAMAVSRNQRKEILKLKNAFHPGK